MRKAGWVAVAVAVMAALGGGMLYAQRGGGARGGAAAGPAAAAFDAQRTRTALESLGLSAPEVTAATKATEAKWKARQTLGDELQKLRTVADNPQSTEAQLTQAVSNYTKAMQRYQATVTSEDAALSKQLSIRSRARCLAAGVLDNGFGFGMRVRTRAGAAGPPAGGRGGRATR